MTILLTTLGLLAVFVALAKVCDEYFVSSLDIIARKLKLSEDVAGATFMAIGTSAPEFFTAAIALTKIGSENVGAGTIVGSAIYNILVIVGASSIVATAYLKWQPVVRDMGFYIISIIVLLLTFQDGRVTAMESTLYLVAYGVYIWILAQWRHWVPNQKVEKELGDISEGMEESNKRTWVGHLTLPFEWVLRQVFPDLRKRPHLYPLTFALSIVFIIALSWMLVELGIMLAGALGVPDVIVALTVLAAGTSVPDTIGSVIVARKGRGDMAVSNAVGSNTFDILICLGLPWLTYSLWTGKEVVVATENLMSSVFLLFFTVIAIFFVLAIRRFRIGRWSGLFLIGLYLLYLAYTIYGVYHPEAFQLESLFR